MSDITRAKLLLLGEPNCGKGALLQSFLKTQTSASSTLPEATPLSDIQISNLVFKSQDASDVLFTTWNMRYNGPTSPMGAMHTLFATPSTVFCIVFDTRSKDTPRLEYWVASVVRAVGANAKILLVGTFVSVITI
jgi:GTPase SAR1 family protein